MQKKGKGESTKPKGILSELQMVVQLVDAKVDLKQYSMHTGGIAFSMPEEVYTEGMECTGDIMPEEMPACVFIRMRELETVRNLRKKGKKKRIEPTYDFLAAHYNDTVISECEIDFSHIHTEEYLPIRIISAKICFDDGRELDYTDKISVFVMDNLASAA